MQMQEKAAQITHVSRVNTDDVGPHLLNQGSDKFSKMPYFVKERDFVNNYLGRFERFATFQRWNQID